METTNGRLQLVVRSRKVLTRIEEYGVSFRTPDGRLHADRRTARIYDYVLDEGQERALAEARELASKSGFSLELTDLSRQSALRRMLGFALDGNHSRVRQGIGSWLRPETASAGHQGKCEDISSQVSRH